MNFHFSLILMVLVFYLLLLVILFIPILHKLIQCIYNYLFVLLYRYTCNDGILQFKDIKIVPVDICNIVLF